ncbi:hypothetical protein ABZZ79_26620 [Streptomyces sp. NPDC006458]|uniref:hypothetical protein n=1 Tax=Streptomyces sp. NPDC006458 TaxID=3154302 RepID=UPI0033B0AF4E
MTPYPSRGLWKQLEAEGRILHRNRDLYDTRHVVHEPGPRAGGQPSGGPRGMSARQLEDGYWRAYREFEPACDLLIRSRPVVRALPAPERTPVAFGGRE